ncbi:MAG: hypothetical protein JWQ40_4350 [Segetibacter sp.]|nr:hypothetical protein [Segetibacter sp.]
MKYSNYLGAIAAVALIYSCFIPWVYIEPIQSTITGFNTASTNFGLPGALHVFFSAVAFVLFLVPQIWAKRTNVLIVTLNFAWAIRNYIIISRCELGECPEKKLGIYAMILFSLFMLVMALLPKVKLSE